MMKTTWMMPLLPLQCSAEINSKNPRVSTEIHKNVQINSRARLDLSGQ